MVNLLYNPNSEVVWIQDSENNLFCYFIQDNLLQKMAINAYFIGTINYNPDSKSRMLNISVTCC